MTRKFTAEELSKIMDMYCEPSCMSYQEIADRFGCDSQTIIRLILKNFAPGDNAGENNYHHKLTEKDVKEMRELYHCTDMSYRDLAKQFGVSKSVCVRAVKRENWRCVE